MDPKSSTSPLDQKQQETLNRIMGTPTASNAAAAPKLADTPKPPTTSPASTPAQTGAQLPSFSLADEPKKDGTLSNSPFPASGQVSAQSPFMTPPPKTGPTEVKSYEKIPLAQAVGTTTSTTTQTTAPSTAPTTTAMPPLGKKRSPVVAVLLVVLGLILIAAYTIIWALVFGIALPFALPI